jgi:hypothetical protein
LSYQNELVLFHNPVFLENYTINVDLTPSVDSTPSNFSKFIQKNIILSDNYGVKKGDLDIITKALTSGDTSAILYASQNFVFTLEVNNNKEVYSLVTSNDIFVKQSSFSTTLNFYLVPVSGAATFSKIKYELPVSESLVPLTRRLTFYN